MADSVWVLLLVILFMQFLSHQLLEHSFLNTNLSYGKLILSSNFVRLFLLSFSYPCGVC